jgi:hypothetical protein
LILLGEGKDLQARGASAFLIVMSGGNIVERAHPISL